MAFFKFFLVTVYTFTLNGQLMYYYTYIVYALGDRNTQRYEVSIAFRWLWLAL